MPVFMKVREFKKIIKSVSKGKKIDVSLISNLDADLRIACIEYMVKKGLPIIDEFLNGVVTSELNSWLHCSGYSYWFTDPQTGFTLRGTSWHQISIAKDTRLT